MNTHNYRNIQIHECVLQRVIICHVPLTGPSDAQIHTKTQIHKYKYTQTHANVKGGTGGGAICIPCWVAMSAQQQQQLDPHTHPRTHISPTPRTRTSLTPKVTPMKLHWGYAWTAQLWVHFQTHIHTHGPTLDPHPKESHWTDIHTHRPTLPIQSHSNEVKLTVCTQSHSMLEPAVAAIWKEGFKPHTQTQRISPAWAYPDSLS